MQKLKTLFTYLTIGLSLLVTTTAFAVEHIHRLAKDHALVFFFASTCKHCHQLAPTLQAIAKTYGLHIFDFSFDGKPIPGFANPGVVTESIFKLKTTQNFHKVISNVSHSVTPHLICHN